MTNSREIEYQALRRFLKTLDGSRSRVARNLSIALSEELTCKQKRAVHLYYIKQMPMQEIADEMGVHVSTVSRTLKRARRRLGRCLRYGGQELLDGEDEY